MKSKANSPDNLYREQLKELGALLQHAREQQSLAIDDVASKALIRANLLRALEAGDLEQLPEPVYVRGLIRRYADVLNLDGNDMASQFVTPIRRQRPSWKDSAAAQLRPLHLYLAYVMVMIAAVSGLSFLLKRNAPEAAILPPLNPLGNSQSDQVANGSSKPDTSLETSLPLPATEAEANQPIRVEMTLTAQSWLRVVTDGKTSFEGVLQQGEQRVWTAEDKLTIRAGNAGGVVVRYNEGSAERLGEPGMVAEVTYSPAQTVSLSF